jgi:type I restriction enzyme R subunit
LNEEERRGIKEQLSPEELAIFDLFTRPEQTKLTKKEREGVKQIAQDLLHTLKAERLVLEWRSKQQARAAVQLAIQVALEKLPPKYDDRLYQQKCGVVYQHVYDSYYGSGSSEYAVAG